MAKLKNIHPGEILLEEFLVPMGVSLSALARAISVPPLRINEIVLGKRGITADKALRSVARIRHQRRILDGFAGGLRPGRNPQADRRCVEACREIGSVA